MRITCCTILFFFLTQSSIYIHVKCDNVTVSELVGSMEEAGESPKKKITPK